MPICPFIGLSAQAGADLSVYRFIGLSAQAGKNRPCHHAEYLLDSLTHSIHVCMDYLFAFTMKNPTKCRYINIPDMDGMGMYG